MTSHEPKEAMGPVGTDPRAPGPEPAFPGLVRRYRYSAAAAGLLVVVLLLVAAWISHSRTRAAVEAQAESVLTLVSREAERLVASSDLLLELVAGRVRDADWSDPASLATLEPELLHLKRMTPDAFRMFVIDAGGIVRIASIDDAAGTDAQGRRYFQAHVEKDVGLHLSEPMLALLDGSLIFVASRRISAPDGTFLGVAVVSFEPDELARFYQSLAVFDDATFVWARDDGRLLMRVPALPADRLLATRLQPSLLRLIGGSPRGQWIDYRSEVDGAQRIAWHRKIGSYPLYAVLGLPGDAVFRSWLATILPYAAVAALALLGLAAAIAYALRWARIEERYRERLARRARTLSSVNEELERRVADRTAALTQALGEKEDLLAQKELLLHEVNHRVGNSLQIVASMLRLQGAAFPGGEVRAHFEEAVSRVTAVARLHERLHRGGEAGSIDLLDYLGDLCADLERSARTGQSRWRVDVVGDAVRLAPDVAVSIGLAVNELVTNAFKYGRPADPAPDAWTVEVGVARSGDGGVTVSVRDRGPGPGPGLGLAGSSGATGFGMRLVRAMAERFGGRLEVGAGDPGARFVLHLRPGGPPSSADRPAG